MKSSSRPQLPTQNRFLLIRFRLSEGKNVSALFTKVRIYHMLDTVLDLRIIEMSKVWFLPYGCLILLTKHSFCCCSAAKSCPILWPHGLQHARLLCTSLSLGGCSNSCPVFLSIRVFSSELALHIRSWSFTYWSFSFSISPSNEYSGFISFTIDWFELLAVQGTLKSLSNTTSQKHQFFGTQLSLQSSSHIHTWLLQNW